jgi:hypothetical protein
MVGSAVAMMVWSRAARNMASRTPRMIVRISAWLRVPLWGWAVGD